ncbi:hypothetical protein ACA097_20545 [Pseudomonas sp. QL9]|uniref:Uncharacterized protein n=1 Tax=Pseudomonas knackmussii (strain DSM 6978 / CCUG 54928 / LMG 23759 / B13) TaxID=1301098 RepID=A0A024HM06_PSEKB|nr:hypothetical protein [Pseudomonas knackmussii]CDF85547.1 hypothetical protein PKB_4222 [Pseudomonas knackmussii B13]
MKRPPIRRRTPAELDKALRLEPGMLFTIEPMIYAGRTETREPADA